MMGQSWKSRLMMAFALYPLWLAPPSGLAQTSINSSLSDQGKSSLEPFGRSTMALDSSGASVGTIRKRVDEVVAFFTVTKGHRYVDNLRESDINIVDDGKPPTRISDFGHQSDLPLRLGVLVDTSDSVRHRFKFERSAINRFLKQILRSQTDEVFLTGFSQHSNLVQDYTDNPKQVDRRFSLLSFGGNTAMYDAVRLACRKLAEQSSVTSARILLLLSDGDDNLSESTMTQAIESAQRADVSIYTISTSDSPDKSTGDEVLQLLAAETGGKAFFPKDPDHIVNSFRSIRQELRNRYMVAYRPDGFVFDGKFRPIQIFVKRAAEEFRVHTRLGYYAPLIRDSR
jgi:Ca-activated chloride channel homolog